MKAIKTAISLIESGELVNIFPQGTRRKKQDPTKTPVKSGVGMIAYHAKCPVIPVFIKAKNNHLHMFGRNEIIIGNPISFEDFGFENGGMKEYERASRTVFAASCALGGYDYPVDTEEGADGK